MDGNTRSNDGGKKIKRALERRTGEKNEESEVEHSRRKRRVR